MSLTNVWKSVSNLNLISTLFQRWRYNVVSTLVTNVREQRWINVREKRWFNVVNQRWFNVVNQRWEKRFKSQRYPNVGNQRYLTLKQRSRAHWAQWFGG